MMHTKRGEILVIGGYGNVGRSICNALAEDYPGNVYAAGRSYKKARNFSDQHTIIDTLGVTSASTWICFDSRWITRVFWILSNSGLMKMFPQSFLLSAISRSSSWIPGGSDRFMLNVSAHSKTDEEWRGWMYGNGEGKMTGLITAEVARKILRTNQKSGVHHIEEMFELEDFRSLLLANNVNASPGLFQRS